ncbi:MurR/RpiR family transcriptional regulator [Clostridium carnis]
MGDLIYRLLLFLNSSKDNDLNYTIAITMLQNIKEIPNMSINKLADICYTSPATITRFCHKLGYSSLIEFKQNAKFNIDNYYNGLMKPNSMSFDISREDILNNMSLEINNEILQAKNFFDLKIIDRVIDLIFSKDYVYIFGTQFAQLMAQDLQRKFVNVSKLIYHSNDVQEQEHLAEKLDENSLAILISPTGRFNIYHERLWKKIKSSSATLVIISESKKPEYKKHSDYIIYLPPQNSSSDYIQNNRYALNYLIEYIYIRYGNLYSKR